MVDEAENLVPAPEPDAAGEATSLAPKQTAQRIEVPEQAVEAAAIPENNSQEPVAVANSEAIANQVQSGADAGEAVEGNGLGDEHLTTPYGDALAPQPSAAPAPAAPDATDLADVEPIGELQIQWKQKGDEVAPLLEMRAYLDQLKEAGVAVGALQLERGEDGKLSGRFGVSYDPESNKLGQLEATLQGFKQVENGLAVVEKPGQAAARRQEAGYDDDYEPPRSKQVKEAFGVKQWDALSANLADVPKTALTVPEQVQQKAAERRVEQLAQQQGKTKEQVLKEGKSLFDIDTSGNPASAFLKNFYAHLNGNPRTRQTLEVDYDRTREQLQARLLKRAGSAQPDHNPEQAPRQAAHAQPKGDATSPVVATPAGATAATPKPEVQATVPTLFQAADVPQKVLASLGISIGELEHNGQLQKLLSGQKTDLLPLQVAGPDGQEPVQFEGKMVLRREENGTATLKLELPQEKLVIPHEIGGQAFTPEQRQKLETEGNAGLVRGLRDAQGQEYNGYVAVDKAMNQVVILPESKVTLQDTIAGVKLSKEQCHDLREGKPVNLSNMASGNGGRKFDGTVQVNAAKACLEIRPATHELQQKQTVAAKQVAAVDAPKEQKAKVEAPTVRRGPRL
ncbi:DUF3945 domain-containing protein [Hymenobacter sp. B81]|uniref:DUF3945 domain-containing protein n=1 Tax=Hymenobacter sp. B81 TaxID=3344878 RepID=UPI0037DC4ABD